MVEYLSRDLGYSLSRRHVNCCNPEDKTNGGWGIFNAILGWQNSATIGSVVSYCVYWIFVTLALIIMRIDERRVADNKATLWRTMLCKGPKGSEEGNGVVIESHNDSTNNSVIREPITRVEGDVENLVG